MLTLLYFPALKLRLVHTKLPNSSHRPNVGSHLLRSHGNIPGWQVAEREMIPGLCQTPGTIRGFFAERRWSRPKSCRAGLRRSIVLRRPGTHHYS
jgi:hypothetical protein